jgi:Flp pilus assembly protein CpaB
MEYAQKLLSTRGGTLVFAGIAALIAAIAVFVYVTSYRDSVKEGAQASHVLVSTSFIAEGTPGEAVARDQSFRIDQVREAQLPDGALTDPAALRDRTAVSDIYPGTQLTEADFEISGTALSTTLARGQRAVSIPLDTAHGIVNDIRVGDRVDVYAAYTLDCNGGQQNMLRRIMQDVQVVELRAGGAGTGSRASHFTLRVNPQQAANLAFASDFGTIWFTLRPNAGAKPTPPSVVTLETQMLGVPPAQAFRACGGRR